MSMENFPPKLQIELRAADEVIGARDEHFPCVYGRGKRHAENMNVNEVISQSRD